MDYDYDEEYWDYQDSLQGHHAAGAAEARAEDECWCEDMEQAQPCGHCIETKYE